MKGREELESGPRPLGDYFQMMPNGRVIILRGKFKAAYLDSIPGGYIRNFLLKKCKQDMTPREIELCERYAGEEIKIIKRTLRMKTKTQVEVSGRALTDAFDKAAEQGCAEISLTIPVPDTLKKATVIDKLRMRGTPLELIGSYLVAETLEDANAAYRTSVLETIFEHLKTTFDATVSFLASSALAKEGEHLGYLLSRIKEGDLVSIALCSAHDDRVGEFSKPDDTLFVPMAKLEVPEVTIPILDAMQAAVIHSIMAITENVEKLIRPHVERAKGKFGAGEVTFIIVPDKSGAKIHRPHEKQIHGSAHIGIMAFLHVSA